MYLKENKLDYEHFNMISPRIDDYKAKLIHKQSNARIRELFARGSKGLWKTRPLLLAASMTNNHNQL